MLADDHYLLPTGTLSVVLVIAISSITALVISAWLACQVARRAIDKAQPENVPLVVEALGSLLSSLHLFLPWRCQADADRPAALTFTRHQKERHNEMTTESPPEAGSDAA